MGLRNEEEYYKNLAANFDGRLKCWDFLNKAFGDSNIELTDCDATVEKNGWFLFIESKSHGTPVPLGQSIFFDRLYKRGGMTIVYLTYVGEEKTGEVGSIQIHEAGKSEWITIFPTDDGFNGEEWLFNYMKNWYEEAKKSKFYDLYEIKLK